LKTKKTTRKRIRQLSDEPKSTVVIPYVQDLSEAVSRVYKRHGKWLHIGTPLPETIKLLGVIEKQHLY